MSTPRDDDALSWGGDDDPTLDVGEKHAATHAAGPAPRAGGQAVESEQIGAEQIDAAQIGAQPVDAEPIKPLQPAAAPVGRHPEPSRSESTTDDDSADDDPDAAHAAPLGNVGLVGIGMVAATFLLFAIGWLLAGLRLNGLGLPIPSVTVIGLTIGAALAPLVWFVAVLALTRSWRTWQRFLLLIVGIVLLVPWPFLSLGAFA